MTYFVLGALYFVLPTSEVVTKEEELNNKAQSTKYKAQKTKHKKDEHLQIRITHNVLPTRGESDSVVRVARGNPFRAGYVRRILHSPD